MDEVTHWVPLSEPPVAAQEQPEPKECGTCGGSGIWSSNDEFDNGGDGHTNSYCPDCHGTGKAGALCLDASCAGSAGTSGLIATHLMDTTET